MAPVVRAPVPTEKTTDYGMRVRHVSVKPRCLAGVGASAARKSAVHGLVVVVAGTVVADTRAGAGSGGGRGWTWGPSLASSVVGARRTG